MAQPVSWIRAPDGRQVALNVRGCVWSGEFPENSLAALTECLTGPVARAEIDFKMLGDGDFLVTHDTNLDSATTGSGPVRLATRLDVAQLQCRWRGEVWNHRPPLLSEVVELLQAQQSPTVLELDAKDVEPWPYSRVDELARLLQPVRNRVIVSGRADWNLRRLALVDSSIRVGFNLPFTLTGNPPTRRPMRSRPKSARMAIATAIRLPARATSLRPIIYGSASALWSGWCQARAKCTFG